MKKYFNLKSIILFLIIVVNINMLTGCSNEIIGAKPMEKVVTESNSAESNNEVRILNYDEVKNSLIRFHVIANSDTDEDQSLKLKVRDKVIDYLYPYLNKSESLDESRKIIKENMDKVKEIAETTIRENSYNYDVKVQLSRENFPDKSYGNIVLPQGNYEAFRVIIGSGEGRNWWCVMFPPLCFVDESKAEVEYDKVEEKIKKNNEKNSDDKDVFSEKENDGQAQEDKDSSEDNIQVKFKIVEVIENLF